MKFPVILLGIIFLCCSVLQTKAQCCAAGNPITTNYNSGSCLTNTFGISLYYQHSYSNTYFEGNKVSDFEYIKDSYFDFTSMNISYTLFQNFNINADIGFFFDKTQNFDFGNGAKFDRMAQGIGDASVGCLYTVNLLDDNSFSLSPSIRATLPVGQFDQKDGAVVLPIDIQPSSGNFKYEFGLTLAKIISGDLTLLSANTFEFSQRIETERTNYKYGNLYNVSLIGIYKIIPDLSAICQFRTQIREKSSDKDRNLINSTGGIVVFFTPQLSFNIMNDLSLNIQYELPIYKDMNGIQLTNNYAFGMRISKIIGLGSNFSAMPAEVQIDKTLKYKEIKVSGNCEMCEERIEKIASEFENVNYAEWNIETHILKIGFEKEPDFNSIKKAIANAGHDNETYTARDEDYNHLPLCCKYRK
jgi:hypothetical protein